MNVGSSRISKWLPKIALSFLTFMAVIGFLLIIPLPPHGKFSDKNIGSVGLAYYEFKDSRAFLKVPYDSEPSAGYHTNFLGTYSKENGQWILRISPTNKFVLKTHLLAIHISDPNANPDSINADMVHPRMMPWDK